MSKKVTIAYVFERLYSWRLACLCYFSTYYTKFLYKMIGVKIDKGTRFYGVPFILLHSESTIKIGGNCVFRTARISNLIGLNRRTTLSTQNENAEIIIGENCGFSAVVIGARKSIIIGKNVMVGANVLITDHDWHSMDPDNRENGIPETKPVKIEDNVFIGYSSSILKGVTIGKNSVIGANSVVTKDIPENVIAAGNPCKIIRSLT
ncbi:MAG: acyltransferase [Ginsengibacter sp.]|jgi:acetyltransferase-like isoleucine patch superfamily enzyme